MSLQTLLMSISSLVPYMFDNREQYYEFIDGEIGDEMLLATEPSLRGLGYFDAGARSFYTDKPILKPEDLKGLRIRVMPSAIAVDMISAFGGSATQLVWVSYIRHCKVVWSMARRIIHLHTTRATISRWLSTTR